MSTNPCARPRSDCLKFDAIPPNLQSNAGSRYTKPAIVLHTSPSPTPGAPLESSKRSHLTVGVSRYDKISGTFFKSPIRITAMKKATYRYYGSIRSAYDSVDLAANACESGGICRHNRWIFIIGLHSPRTTIVVPFQPRAAR
jgi:hypothetical protein